MWVLPGPCIEAAFLWLQLENEPPSAAALHAHLFTVWKLDAILTLIGPKWILLLNSLGRGQQGSEVQTLARSEVVLW